MRPALKLSYHDHKERVKKAIKIRRRAKNLWSKKLKSKALAKTVKSGIHFFKPVSCGQAISLSHLKKNNKE